MSVDVTPRSSVDLTDDDRVGHSEDEKGEIYSDCSIHTLVQETVYNMDDDFNPDLPTEFGTIEEATSVKDVVTEKKITEIDESKSEEKVLVLAKSTKSTKVSKPPATPKNREN